MNAKLLYAATVAFALASSLAVAGENQPLSRAEVVKDLSQARADGTLRKNDYDYDAQDRVAPSSRTRNEVLAEMRVPRNPALVGPLRNRTYNPGGMELLGTSNLARADVKAGVVTAMREGTLRRTDYDDEVVRVSRRVPVRSPAPVLAGNATTRRAGS